MVDRLGQQIGNYRIIRKLGRGGFADVYLGEHVHLRTQAAIKILHAVVGPDEYEQFLTEGRTIAHLEHPHIVRVLDYGIDEQGAPFLVMVYAPGGTLRERHPAGQALPLTSILPYVEQIAQALDYIHAQKLVHRDVKPANVLLRANGMLLLSDFGLASLAHTTSSLGDEGFVGTPAYMAPEQLLQKPRPQSDQYALAIMVYEWLTGRLPFQGTRWQLYQHHLHTPPPLLRDVIPTLSPLVETVILTALSKDPRQRFRQVEAFANALKQASFTGSTETNVSIAPTAPPVVQPAQSLRVQQVSRKEPPLVSEPGTPLIPSPRDLKETPPPFPGHTPVPPVLATGAGIPQPVHQQRLPGKRAVILILLALLLVGSGSLGYLGLKNYSERMQATVTAQVNPTGTAQAQDALHAYEHAVAAHGIMAGFDLAHSNWNPYEKTLTPSNVPHLALRWSYKVGRYVQTTPVEAGGIVYVSSDKLYAFDATCRSACQPLWSYGVGDLGSGSPAVVKGLVYAVYGDGKLHVFDATCRSACQPLWSYGTGGVIYDTPVVSNGMVYVGSHYNGPNYAVSHLEDLKLSVFDTSCHSTCQPLWSYTMKDSIDPPTVTSGILYISTGSGKLYAFDATCRSACQPLWSWSRPNPEYLPHSPVVTGKMAYILFQDGQLYAFDATCRSACQPLWSYQAGTFSHASPSTDGKTLYASSSDELYAFDATCRSACQPLWSWPLGGSSDFSSPFLANGVIYIGIGNTIAAFDASCRSACQALWSYPTGDAVESDATVASGVVYVGSEDGQLYAFHLPKGP